MQSDRQQEKDFYIFNIHTHIFTKDHVPKYLAKKFVIWPLYLLLGTDLGIKIIKLFTNRKRNSFSYEARNKRWSLYKWRMFIIRNSLYNIFYVVFKLISTLVFSYYLVLWLNPLLNESKFGKWIYPIIEVYIKPYLPNIETGWNQFFVLLAFVFVFGHLRIGLSKLLKTSIQKFVGKERLKFLLRYLNIIKYSDKKEGESGMSINFRQLKQQYPSNSRFVILPMDMEFMSAGRVREPFLEQMKGVMLLKQKNQNSFFPFVHVDPRRIENQLPNEPFFTFSKTKDGSVQLKDCQLKTYLDQGACGIKIYPALGYYPFDKNLLPLWLFCAQNEIPITTHCSVGPIFYRGKKKKVWDRHPVFEEVISGKAANNNQVFEKLRLMQVKNKDFQANFTHPLNYCCLLMPHFLKQLLDEYNDDTLNSLFGYKKGTLEQDLSKLKINLAHYGGAENWDRFLDKDRQRVANEIVNRPLEGLRLKSELTQVGNLYAHWHYSDWFSIISSMIIEFENVYTDISYTAHNTQYLNLLSEVMNHPKIQERVLFGTDFYVVSNQKTEKAYWIDMQNQLSEDKWQKLAFDNPNHFI
ncbi:amidohydrolase family protein [Croceitalea vernalis]|uniref:Amidohydrolase family protein n=1 Tax=Croceitalea vernalis TaxID=3075599 RepID=A0ABU3BER4_9FLAO|nr:amidohydrolase family protein [Croceitalea sp. P007]MDT0620646.1 amidohydrolase family protein [Croceitalea sp. P007]